MDLLGFEPRAFRMQSGCDTTTPQAPWAHGSKYRDVINVQRVVAYVLVGAASVHMFWLVHAKDFLICNSGTLQLSISRAEISESADPHIENFRKFYYLDLRLSISLQLSRISEELVKREAIVILRVLIFWEVELEAFVHVAAASENILGVHPNVSYGVRTHAHMRAVDLKSTPLTTRAN